MSFFSSDNVPLDQELKLKKIALKRNLLMMGPGCGTAIIDGIGLGFANIVRRGTIGIVGASGSGIQEVSSLVHKAGFGISQAIGVGSRDLDSKVGGIMMMKGLEVLESDKNTEIIVLISKSPGPSVQKKISKRILTVTKPVVVNFIGTSKSSIADRGSDANYPHYVYTLEDAAFAAVALSKRRVLKRGRGTTSILPSSSSFDSLMARSRREFMKLSKRQKFVRGLFSGGSLCQEAAAVLRDMIGHVYSNVSVDRVFPLVRTDTSKMNTCLDMGDQEFTKGRPHPMIDYTLRQERILKEAHDDRTAVILLDIELGIGIPENPSSILVPTITKARDIARRRNGYLATVGSITGTERDPQNIKRQIRSLIKAGVVVLQSNAQAVRMAALIASRRNLGIEKIQSRQGAR